MFIPLKGYYSTSSFEWSHNDRVLDERSPLLYCAAVGLYKCSITTNGNVESRMFNISRGWLSLFIIMYFYFLSR